MEYIIIFSSLLGVILLISLVTFCLKRREALKETVKDLKRRIDILERKTEELEILKESKEFSCEKRMVECKKFNSLDTKKIF